jgi:hypothetical protein
MGVHPFAAVDSRRFCRFDGSCHIRKREHVAMTHRRNTTHTSPRAIHCAVVEAPAMSDNSGHRPATGFRELLPWADPYIASLIDKLRRSAGCDGVEFVPKSEVEPPLDSPDRYSDRWDGQWRPRNWGEE